MTQQPPDSREMGYYFALGQVGLEMVAPMGLGIALDYYLGWTPWATIGGLVFGFFGGLAHLVVLVNKHDVDEGRKRTGGAP